MISIFNTVKKNNELKNIPSKKLSKKSNDFPHLGPGALFLYLLNTAIKLEQKSNKKLDTRKKLNNVFYPSVMCPKDADGTADSVDTVQTAPRSSLIWVYIVCPDLSVRKLSIIMV